MEPLPGRRESNYYWDEEDRDEPLSQRQPTALPPPPSSSPSSSSSVRWGGGPRQMEYSTEEDHYHPPADSGSPSALFVEKEHMFDKVVTPSDVGKLNRLVIPKQHAEKYFPLDASAGEKGLLLSFEDRTGKHWRFRYSYWNSSQSYVMTKGWSRFVKEKRLDAGDTVSFGRGVGEAARHRLFIDWRHRPDALPSYPLLHCLPLRVHGHVPSPVFPFARSAVPWGRLVVPPSGPSVLPAMAAYDHLVYGHNSAGFSNPYLRSAGNPSQVAVQLGIGRGSGSAGEEEETSAPMVFDSVPLARSNAAARTVRLFGVNLGCSPSEANTGVHAATHGHAPPPALAPLQMRLGAPDVVEPPAGRDQQPAGFLDLAM